VPDPAPPAPPSTAAWLADEAVTRVMSAALFYALFWDWPRVSPGSMALAAACIAAALLDDELIAWVDTFADGWPITGEMG
jgi:hypothetical protein